VSPEDLRDLLQRRPFVPFRLFLRGGTTVEIPHPGAVVLGPAAAVIGVPGDADEPHICGCAETVAFRDILCLEPLTPKNTSEQR
jgi:hypothetical protein